MNKWNSSIPWNKDSSYIIRCLEATFGASKAGNPMITFKYEVAAPESMEVGSETYSIAGTGITTWQVCQTLEGEEGSKVINVEKTKQNADALVKLFGAFSLITPAEVAAYTSTGTLPSAINPENVDTKGFIGKCVYALLYNDQQEQRKSPTAAQLAAGQRVGDVMVHPVTKVPLKTNFPKIGDIYGLAPTSGNAF